MFERKFYPLVDMDSNGREKFAMFGSTASEDETRLHELCLMETVPRYYRLRSKAPLTQAEDSGWRVHCPLCGHAMKSISAPGSVHSRSLYHCPKCSGRGEKRP